jgi:hypothetical protein
MEGKRHRERTWRGRGRQLYNGTRQKKKKKPVGWGAAKFFWKELPIDSRSGAPFEKLLGGEELARQAIRITISRGQNPHSLAHCSCLTFKATTIGRLFGPS